MMIGSGLRLALAFSRLSVCGTLERRSVSTACGPLYFQMTNAVFAEPLKKKKRMDPSIIKMREERRKKKLEKQIRRLQKVVQTLKPIEEIEQSKTLMKELEQRKREVPPVSPEEAEQRLLLEKEWCRYKLRCYLKDKSTLESILHSQEQALEELKAESEDLYEKAIQLDMGLLPYQVSGPVSTPPIENYVYPDGEYADITKKYDGE